jgi:hypothetical protein
VAPVFLVDLRTGSTSAGNTPSDGCTSSRSARRSGAPGLTARKWLHPTLDIFARALPFTYRDVEAAVGRSLRFEVLGDAGGVWTLARVRDGWRLLLGSDEAAATKVTVGQEIAWKLFSKGLSKECSGGLWIVSCTIPGASEATSRLASCSSL